MRLSALTRCKLIDDEEAEDEPSELDDDDEALEAERTTAGAVLSSLMIMRAVSDVVVAAAAAPPPVDLVDAVAPADVAPVLLADVRLDCCRLLFDTRADELTATAAAARRLLATSAEAARLDDDGTRNGDSFSRST